MICGFCKHVLPEAAFAGITEQAAASGGLAHNVDCPECGARYALSLRVVRKPTISAEQIKRIENRAR